MHNINGSIAKVKKASSGRRLKRLALMLLTKPCELRIVLEDMLEMAKEMEQVRFKWPRDR